jgi:hypothetical protein
MKKQIYPKAKENKLLFFLVFSLKIKSAKVAKNG